MQLEVKRGEVCLIVQKQIKQRINYGSSSIMMGKEYKFAKVLNSSQQGYLEQMKNFIQLQRIQQVHGQSNEGSCVCINGRDFDKRQFYFAIILDYLTQLLSQRAQTQVEIFIQGKNLISYQLIEQIQQQNKQIKKTRLDFYGRVGSQQFTHIYNDMDQLDPILKELENEMNLDDELNVNVIISQFDTFKVQRKYSVILVTSNFTDLIQFWQRKIINQQTFIFNNTWQYEKSVISFLDTSNNLNIQRHLQQLSFIQEELNNNQLEENFFQKNYPSQASQSQQLEHQQKLIQVNDVNFINQSQQDAQIDHSVAQWQQSEIKQQMPNQNDQESHKSSQKDNKEEKIDIITLIQDQLEAESRSETKILQVYMQGPIVNVLDLQDFKKFSISKINYKGRLKLQILDGVFDFMETKIIFRKSDCSTKEQQRKIRRLIQTCVSSNMNYFYMIVGKLPKKFFIESR